MIMIVGFYLYAAIHIFRAVMLDEKTVVDLGLSWCMGIVASLACIADSKVLGCSMPHAAKWVMLCTWQISVPIYMFWSRGVGGGINALFIFLGTYVAIAFSLSFL